MKRLDVVTYRTPADLGAEVLSYAHLVPDRLDDHYGETPRADVVRTFASGAGDKGHGESVRQVLAAMRDGLPAPNLPRWERTVAGALPVVGAYMSGSPRAMMGRRPSQATPVRVVASVAASQGWSAEEVAKRGAAVAALVARLSASRPVELWISCELRTDDHVARAYRVRIPSAPLDVDRVAHALCSIEVLRKLFFTLSHGRAGEKDGCLGWAFGLSAAEQYAGARKAFNLTERDVYVPGMVWGRADDNAEILRDPVAWVAKTVAGLK